jgi:hypothetical protein
MRTYDHGFEGSRGRVKRKKKGSGLEAIQRYIASLSEAQVSRMMEDSGKSYANGQDVTGHAIFKNTKRQQQEKIQAKLEISQPEDQSEKQADKVAEGVTKGDVSISKMALDQTPSDINTKSEDAGMTTTPSFDQQLQGTKGQGSKLDTKVQSEMEGHLGTDLSGVNVHTGGEAQKMSGDINAKAFAHGQDVYFNEGQYNPSSQEGKGLLAHELTHTVQQNKDVDRKIQKQSAVTKPKGLYEEIGVIDYTSKPDIKPFAKGKMGSVSYIVTHQTGGSTLSGDIATLKTRNLSSHYIIDTNGDIILLVPIDKKGGHVLGNIMEDVVNGVSVGIENVGRWRDFSSLIPKSKEGTEEWNKEVDEIKRVIKEEMILAPDFRDSLLAMDGKALVKNITSHSNAVFPDIKGPQRRANWLLINKLMKEFNLTFDAVIPHSLADVKGVGEGISIKEGLGVANNYPAKVKILMDWVNKNGPFLKLNDFVKNTDRTSEALKLDGTLTEKNLRKQGNKDALAREALVNGFFDQIYTKEAELDEALLLTKTIDTQDTPTLFRTMNSLKVQFPKANGLEQFKINAIYYILYKRSFSVRIEIKDQDDWFGNDKISIKIKSKGGTISSDTKEIEQLGSNTWVFGLSELLPLEPVEKIKIEIYNGGVLKESFEWDYNDSMFYKTDNPVPKKYNYWIDIKYTFSPIMGNAKNAPGLNEDKKDKYDHAVLNGSYVYTKNYGWVDTTHAFSTNNKKLTGAATLWNQIKDETGSKSRSPNDDNGFLVSYRQDAKVMPGVSRVGVTKEYFVKYGLSIKEKEKVALAIFQEVSMEFEGLQGMAFWSGSSFEPADLPSNMLSFYNALRPELTKDKIMAMIEPLTSEQSLAVYRRYPGTFTEAKYKNHNFSPKFFMNEYSPLNPQVPDQLKEIKAAVKGEGFRDWIELFDVHAGIPPITGPK